MTQLGLQVSHRVTSILGIHGCVVEVGAYRIHIEERYEVKRRSKVGGSVGNGRELFVMRNARLSHSHKVRMKKSCIELVKSYGIIE